MKKDNITPQIDYFLDVLESESAKKKKDCSRTILKIENSELAGQMALWYEKVRTAVQYKEEHLLRRTAIFRILKRLILFEQKKKKRSLTITLFLELAMAGYISDKESCDDNFKKGEKVISKYLKVLEIANKLSLNPAESMERRRWFLSMAAEEIENIFNPQTEKMALVYSIYETFRPKMKFVLERPPYPFNNSRLRGIENIAEEYFGVGSLIEPISDSIFSSNRNVSPNEDLKNQQTKLLNMLVYIAIFRNLRRSDRVMLRSLVFNIYFPSWNNINENEEDKIKKIVKGFAKKKKEIETIAEHPLITRILYPIKKYMLCASFLFEAVGDNPKEARAFVNQEYLFREKIKEKCQIRYQREKKKLKKRILRGIIYVFLTKMLLALVLEIPYEMSQAETVINYQALFINLIFPPMLLWILASSAKQPTDENTKEIIKGIEALTYKSNQEENLKEIKVTDRENAFAERVLDLFYVLIFALVIYSLIRFLIFLNFNIVAIIIFTFFTGTVSFFGALIRQSMRDLVITKDKEGFLSLVFDTVLLPFVRLGRLISVKFSRINVFIFLLDFLVEAPFKFIIRAFEAWIGFLKRKRDEIERQLD